ncbi:MAG: response regulator [Terriglobales bacterium]|jgi:ActR/RegA family two-component response regulator
MVPPKVLLVDDNDQLRRVLQRVLENNNFEVVPAASVTEALTQIVAQKFDVLITDLHMPGPGDGFSVVTAMRHAQPEALTLVVSGFPDVQGAMSAILLQADEVLVKPFDVKKLAELIRQKKQESKPSPRASKESVASILERDVTITIERWLSRAAKVEALVSLPLTDQERTDHLPEMLKNIAHRLRKTRTIEALASPSPAAVAHGQLRYQQGYTAPLIVQESRILQVCVFETIQRNLGRVDFSLVLPDIMLIADEIDSQLTQSVDSFLSAAAVGVSAA